MRRRVWRRDGKGLLKGISETFGAAVVDDGMDSFRNEIESCCLYQLLGVG